LVGAYALAVVFGRGPDIGHRMLDALKLFPQFPGVDNGHRWEYILARQLAAIVLLAVTIGVVAALLSDRIAELRARFRRDHAVVCGLGETGLRNALAFRAQGIPTTCIELKAKGDATEAARNAGALILHRDATQVSTLENARVDRAEWIICSCPDDATNTRIASIVVEIASRNGSKRAPKVEVQIDNPQLARVLRGPLASVGPAHLHFFNTSHVWARALLDEAFSPSHDSEPVPTLRRIAVLGSNSLGTAVVVEAARRWHGAVRTHTMSDRLQALLVGPGASATTARLRKRYPALERVCDVEPVDDDLEPGGPLELGTGEWDAVFACLDDESVNLAVALETEHVVTGGTPVLLPSTASVDALAPLFTGATTIRTVSLTPGKTSFDLLHDQMTDVIARAVHASYLGQRRTERDFGARPADRPWDQLSEEDIRSNQAHAEGMIEQLRATWHQIEPLYDWDESPAVLEPAAIAAMNELEHERWRREKLAAGWQYGPERDDDRKVHDLLVPWSELPEKERRIDRALVASRPAVLAAAGFRVTREPAREQLARELHEAYAATYAGAKYAVPWDELPEAKRESNRAAVDHLPIKLVRIGCRIVPRGHGVARRFVLTSDEIEEMAKLEHRRWVAEQTAAEQDRSTVEWSDLSEADREKDRNIARKIPEQLLAVGYGVVRD